MRFQSVFVKHWQTFLWNKFLGFIVTVATNCDHVMSVLFCNGYGARGVNEFQWIAQIQMNLFLHFCFCSLNKNPENPENPKWTDHQPIPNPNQSTVPWLSSLVTCLFDFDSTEKFHSIFEQVHVVCPFVLVCFRIHQCLWEKNQMMILAIDFPLTLFFPLCVRWKLRNPQNVSFVFVNFSSFFLFFFLSLLIFFNSQLLTVQISRIGRTR